MAPVAFAVAVDFAVGDVITFAGVLWVPAVVVVSAVAGVLLLLTSLPHTSFSTDSGVLLLFPAVPVFCCASKGPAAAVVTAVVYVPGIFLWLESPLLLPSPTAVGSLLLQLLLSLLASLLLLLCTWCCWLF
jgi:hypothetical protein